MKTSREPPGPQDPSISQPAAVPWIMIAGEAPADILVAAAQLRNAEPAVRSTIVTSLIGQARSQGYDCEKEICGAAGYRDANEYWQVKTSEPMKAPAFADLLALHLLDPTERLSVACVAKNADGKPVVALGADGMPVAAAFQPINEFDPHRSRVQARVESALLRALEANESWFIRDRVPLLRDATRSDLAALRLDPCAAAKWMLSKPRWRDLVPPGLRAFLEAEKRTAEGDEAVHRTGFAGRPSSKSLCEAEMRRRAAAGKLLPTLSAECEHLSQWLRNTHPKAPAPKTKTLKNGLRATYRELKESPKQ